MLGPAGAANPLLAVLVGGLVLVLGAYATTVLEVLVAARVAGTSPARSAAVVPLQRAAALLRRPVTTTERPDAMLWALAPALYAALAATVVAVLPLDTDWAIADVRTGIVVIGSAEVLAMVAVHLHGWAPNSPLPLIGGYRFIASGLSFLLLSMFVLIAAALPAESMSLGAIAASQEAGVWNLIRQPLGLPLFLVVALGVTFYGPLDVADGADIGGGTAAEASGPGLLAWEWARRAMLTAYAMTTAVVFMAGPAGPLLPGPVWLALKSLAVLAVLVVLRHHVGRIGIQRFVLLAWTVLLPVSFVHLALAGAVAL